MALQFSGQQIPFGAEDSTEVTPCVRGLCRDQLYFAGTSRSIGGPQQRYAKNEWFKFIIFLDYDVLLYIYSFYNFLR